MRILIILLMMAMLSACSLTQDNPEKRVSDFYLYYLNVFANSHAKIKADPEKMNDFISQKTRQRLDVIAHIYEQEIIDSDYYTYAQDYSAEWIPFFRTGKAQDTIGGKYVNVWLGSENNKTYQLGVYLTSEEGRWKIYRVKSITDNYEQYIFDDHAIDKARAYAVSIE
ncbi:YbjP/YqhG family protein [Enterobacter sp.]|uniref:YbjP/YqhG family protein n=1 Tax=Enterobacter sp. TaxID=42895 RepID=UPI00296E3CDB|nr:YbjP/YqhG family protein [Enterobacter sp.]